MLLLDAGTTYSKTFNTENGAYNVFPTKDLSTGTSFALAAGHFSGGVQPVRKVNELVALAIGGLKMISDNDFCLLDIGSRDIKYVKILNRQYQSSDWNMSCGAFTGFTLEILKDHFKVEYNSIKVSDTELPVTCGVFAMSFLFDRIAGGESVEQAVAAFVKGIAASAYRFTKKPDKLYLSGGLSENMLFLKSFPAPIVPLGRYVIIEGLKELYKEKNVESEQPG